MDSLNWNESFADLFTNFVKEIWREIGTIGPGDGVNIMVDGELLEEINVLQWLKYWTV